MKVVIVDDERIADFDRHFVRRKAPALLRNRHVGQGAARRETGVGHNCQGKEKGNAT